MYLETIVLLHSPVFWNFSVLIQFLKPQTADAVYLPDASPAKNADEHIVVSETVMTHPVNLHCEELLGFFNAENWTVHSCNSGQSSGNFLEENDARHDMILEDMMSIDDGTCATVMVRRMFLND